MIDYPTIRNHSPTVGIMDSQIPQTTKVKREKNLQFTGFRPNVGKTFAVFASFVHMENATESHCSIFAVHRISAKTAKLFSLSQLLSLTLLKVV